MRYGFATWPYELFLPHLCPPLAIIWPCKYKVGYLSRVSVWLSYMAKHFACTVPHHRAPFPVSDSFQFRSYVSLTNDGLVLVRIRYMALSRVMIGNRKEDRSIHSAENENEIKIHQDRRSKNINK